MWPGGVLVFGAEVGKDLHNITLSGYWPRDVKTGLLYYPCATSRFLALVKDKAFPLQA
jgi:hypothetical protein